MFHADGGVLPVLDADPARKAGAFQDGKDAVVIVQPLPDDAMLQDGGVALRGVGFLRRRSSRVAPASR